MQIKVNNNDVNHAVNVVATNQGKIPLMPDYSIVDRNDTEYTLKNHHGELTRLANIAD